MRFNNSILAIKTLVICSAILISCSKSVKKEKKKEEAAITYPSQVIPFMDQWTILLGDGTRTDKVTDFEKQDFFYVRNDGRTDWVVYKTPNSGVTSRTSSNTRTELGQKKHWIPETGGKLTGTLKVMHVSTSGDARVASAYAVVVGQIHSDEGHENEPLKIFYKKFPGHEKGAVFWNYEINTAGDNSKRWDYSSTVWGYDMSMVGSDPASYPEEPQDGIALGEEFSYEVNVYKGVMYLTFRSEGHETVKFTKNLLKSDFSTSEDIPQQILTLYAPIERDGIERVTAYAGEIQYFKQGAYNQTNGKDPEENIVSNSGSETYGGDIEKQYANGCYAEVWFKDATVGEGIEPEE